MKEDRPVSLVNHLPNGTMENEILFGINAQSDQGHWIHSFKKEIHVIKLSNQHLQWEMANITGTSLFCFIHLSTVHINHFECCIQNGMDILVQMPH